MNSMSREARPSDQRRKTLSEELTIPTVSSFFPLERYYDAAEKVYDSFRLTFQNSHAEKGYNPTRLDPIQDALLDDAYVYGKRYCTFCIDGLKNHNYYNAPKFRPLRRRHNEQVDHVLKMLEMVVNQMDVNETLRAKLWEEESRRRQEEEKRKELERFSALQERMEKQKRSSSSSSFQDGAESLAIEQSALSKLQLLSPHDHTLKPEDQPAASSMPSDSSLPNIQTDPSGVEPMGPPSSTYSLTESSEDEGSPSDLPPPVLPMTPPSYHQAVEGRRQGTNFWGPGGAPEQPPEQIPASSTAPIMQTSQRKTRIPLSVLQGKYESEFRKFQKEGKIQATPIDTYQGRIGASTNGCTVISALVVSHLLQNYKEGKTSGVEDSQVCHVIDRQCGPLLREIRSKLGLGGAALIIPSDVHDHLVDKHLLPQDKFLGAAGGNILDPDHIGEFLKLIASAPDSAGATLFFREHVVSIVKYCNSKGADKYYTYELIDSMPTLHGKASRTRCKGLEAMIVLLRWYASRKFSSRDCKFVDSNVWEDSLADVDPRVFQGFVWGEQPKQ